MGKGKHGNIRIVVSIFGGMTRDGEVGVMQIPMVVSAIKDEHGNALATMPDGRRLLVAKGSFRWL